MKLFSSFSFVYSRVFYETITAYGCLLIHIGTALCYLLRPPSLILFIITPHKEFKEFTLTKQKVLKKSEFKEVLSIIFQGMGEGLKKDQILILRVDGEDLHAFINSPTFKPEMVSLFSEVGFLENSFMKDYIIKALEKLKVDQGMPPTSDSWVMSNIIQPALQSCDEQQQISDETFVAEFKRVAEIVVKNLNEQYVIVAHSENTFDGNGIKRLLSNKFELDKTLEAAVKIVQKNEQGKKPKDYIRMALDELAPSAGLPLFGALDEIDKVIEEVLDKFDTDDGHVTKEDEFKNLLSEILENIMLRLESKPISICTNSVVHEPTAASL